MITILVFVHLMALVGAGASAVALPVLMQLGKNATPEAKATIAQVGGKLRTIARASLVLLLMSGPLLFWLKWDFSAPSAAWFGVKMALVLVVIGAIGIGEMNAKGFQRGDAAATRLVLRSRQVIALALIGIVLAAVFAFSGP